MPEYTQSLGNQESFRQDFPLLSLMTGTIGERIIRSHEYRDNVVSAYRDVRAYLVYHGKIEPTAAEGRGDPFVGGLLDNSFDEFMGKPKQANMHDAFVLVKAYISELASKLVVWARIIAKDKKRAAVLNQEFVREIFQLGELEEDDSRRNLAYLSFSIFEELGSGASNASEENPLGYIRPIMRGARAQVALMRTCQAAGLSVFLPPTPEDCKKWDYGAGVDFIVYDPSTKLFILIDSKSANKGSPKCHPFAARSRKVRESAVRFIANELGISEGQNLQAVVVEWPINADKFGFFGDKIPAGQMNKLQSTLARGPRFSVDY